MNHLQEVHHLHHLVEGVAARLREKHQIVAQAEQVIAEAKAYIAEHTPKNEALFAIYEAKRKAAVDHVLAVN